MKRLFYKKINMVGKIKKAYIDYAINNGYNLDGCDVLDVIDNKIFFQHKIFGEGQFNLIEIITSKDFIEAIARGKCIKENKQDFTQAWINVFIGAQAIAIYENKLEDFITNLLDLGK